MLVLKEPQKVTLKRGKGHHITESCRRGCIQNVYIEAKALRRIDTETGLQKVGSVYSWADQVFKPQLFTQCLSNDLDHHQNFNMSFASLFRIFPNNHVTSSNRSKACVRVYLCKYVCVLFCLLKSCMSVWCIWYQTVLTAALKSMGDDRDKQELFLHHFKGTKMC